MAAAAVTSAVNAVRKVAVNTFGVNAFTIAGASGLYNRARPSYPAEATEKILSLLPDNGPARVVEVGAGTGIFTSNLVNAPSAKNKIASITAIEPSSGMREAFQKNENLKQFQKDGNGDAPPPRVEVKDGSFAEIPVPDASVDLIVGGQCFHWAHPNYESAVTEFARILKPGGTLALIWNLEDSKKAKWVAQIRNAYESYEAGTPQYRLGWWKEMFETGPYKENFDPLQQYDYQVVHPTTEQGVIDRVWSKSYITAQSKSEQEKIANTIREILKKGEDRRWIDEENGVFEYPYETNLFLMRRR